MFSVPEFTAFCIIIIIISISISIIIIIIISISIRISIIMIIIIITINIIIIMIIIIIINIIVSFSPGVSGDIFRNQDSNIWYEGGVDLIEKNLKVKENRNTAKSAVLFVGDGMGITTITAARIYDGQLNSKVKYGEENVLSWENFPWTALAKTYHVDQQGTDSASAATAFLCGIKTNSGMLSTIIGIKHLSFNFLNK